MEKRRVLQEIKVVAARGRRDMFCYKRSGYVKDPCSGGTVLYLTIHVNILVVILYYNFTRCYLGRN